MKENKKIRYVHKKFTSILVNQRISLSVYF